MVSRIPQGEWIQQGRLEGAREDEYIMLNGYVIIFSSPNLSTMLVNEFLNFSVVVQEERGEEGGDGGAQPGQEE